MRLVALYADDFFLLNFNVRLREVFLRLVDRVEDIFVLQVDQDILALFFEQTPLLFV